VADAPVIDLRDKSTPPPDDPERAPFGWRWDTKTKEWKVKRSAGGRKSGAAWLGKRAEPEPDMAEFQRDLDSEDPAPAYATGDGPKVPKSRPKVSAKVKGEITGAVGMVGMLVGPALMSADPYCGGALMDNWQKIAEAVVPLLCQSVTVVGFFTDQSLDWLLWFKLAIVLAPVAAAVGRHHIMKTVELQQDEATGDVYAVPRDLSEYPA